MKKNNKNIGCSCVDCGILNCAKRTGQYPEFCPTAELAEEEIDQVTDLYKNNRVNKKIAVAAEEIEGSFYGRYTRVEEIVEFARRIGGKENRYRHLHRSYRGKQDICKDTQVKRL